MYCCQFVHTHTHTPTHLSQTTTLQGRRNNTSGCYEPSPSDLFSEPPGYTAPGGISDGCRITLFPGERSMNWGLSNAVPPDSALGLVVPFDDSRSVCSGELVERPGFFFDAARMPPGCTVPGGSVEGFFTCRFPGARRAWPAAAARPSFGARLRFLLMPDVEVGRASAGFADPARRVSLTSAGVIRRHAILLSAFSSLRSPAAGTTGERTQKSRVPISTVTGSPSA